MEGTAHFLCAVAVMNVELNHRRGSAGRQTRREDASRAEREVRATHVDDGDPPQAQLLDRVLGRDGTIIEHAEPAAAVRLGVVSSRVDELRRAAAR